MRAKNRSINNTEQAGKPISCNLLLIPSVMCHRVGHQNKHNAQGADVVLHCNKRMRPLQAFINISYIKCTYEDKSQ